MTTYYEVIDAEAEHDDFPTVHRIWNRYTASYLPPEDSATCPEHAAVLWAEKVWHHTDYADELEAIVTSPDGTKHRIHITVEAVPSFHARKIR
jgi:hypothetical protein